MLGKLLKTIALFFMPAQKQLEVNAYMDKETIDEIDDNYSGQVKEELDYINHEIRRLARGLRSAHEIDAMVSMDI